MSATCHIATRGEVARLRISRFSSRRSARRARSVQHPPETPASRSSFPKSRIAAKYSDGSTLFPAQRLSERRTALHKGRRVAAEIIRFQKETDAPAGLVPDGRALALASAFRQQPPRLSARGAAMTQRFPPPRGVSPISPNPGLPANNALPAS
jgi:hypothetical protein